MPRARTLALLALALVALYGLRTAWLGGAFRSIEPHFAGRCQTVTGVAGPEDLTLHPSRPIAYVAGFDRRAVAAGRPGGGAVWAYRPGSGGGLRNLTPDAPPDFRPHGISLWHGGDGPDRLLVIDHEGGSHSIKIFDLVGDGLSLARTLTDPLLVSPNDLVAVGPDRFYVTNDHRWPRGWRNSVEDWLRLPISDVIHFDGTRFRRALSRIRYPNGIDASADGREVYVASTLGRELRVYAPDAETGDLRLRETVPVGSAPDNIEVDAAGALWVGAHPKLFALVAFMGGSAERAPSQVLRVAREGEPGGEWRVEEVFLDDGTAISAASVGSVRDGRLLIGAITGERILDCELPGP